MIELKPVLNKKDLENISLYNKAPYKQLWEENDEWKIYDVVKSLRKEQSYWPSKLDISKPDTYKNKIINKPKVWSPAMAGASFIGNAKDYLNSLERKKTIWEKAKDLLVPDLISTWFKVLKPTATTAIKSTLDTKLQEVYSVPEQLRWEWKWLEIIKWANQRWLENVNLVLQIPERVAKNTYIDLKNKATVVPDYIFTALDKDRTIQDTKEIRKNRELYTRLWHWVQNEWDALSLNTSDEIRKNIINSIPDIKERENAQKYIEDNKWNILATDTIFAVWSWILTWEWLRWALKVIPKNQTALRWIVEVTEKIIDPSLSDLTKLWVIFWASTWLQYLATWETGIESEWAKEWAAILWFSTVLKWLWVAIPEWYKWIKELLQNDEVKKWMDTFFWELADKTWARLNLLPQNQWTWISWKIEEIKVPEQISKEKDIIEVANNIPVRNVFNKTLDNIESNLKKTWYYNDKKNPISNWVNIRFKQLEQLYIDSRINNFVDKYKWTESDIAKLETLGKIWWDSENLIRAFKNKLDKLDWNYIAKYPEYAQLKSRYYQAVKKSKQYINQKSDLNDIQTKLTKELGDINIKINSTTDKLELDKLYKNKYKIQSTLSDAKKKIKELDKDWWKLSTKVIVNWKTIVFNSPDELKLYLDETEKNMPLLRDVSEKQAEVNKYILKYYYDSWIINKDELYWLLENPYYIPWKLSEETKAQNIWEKLYWDKEKLIKALWSWSEDLDFSLDGLDNLVWYYKIAFQTINRNNLIWELKEVAERNWNDLKNLDNKEWYIPVPYFKNWEREDIFIPKFMEAFFKIDNPSNNILARWLRYWNQLFKWLVTWVLAPLFTAKMTLSEIVQWMMQSANKWANPLENLSYIKNKVQSKITWEDKEYYDALSQYIDAVWASYGLLKWTVRDMWDELASDIYYSRNILSKWYMKWLDFAEYVLWWTEKHWTRWPIFENLLKNQAKDLWIDYKEIKKIFDKNFNKDLNFLDSKWVNKDLEKLWIDPFIAAKASRWIFDYLASGDMFRVMWRYISYANLVPVTGKAAYNFTIWWVKSLANMPPKQRVRAMKWITATLWAVQSLAFLNYAHNYWLFQYPWESDESFQERQKLWELLKKQPDYTKFRPWRAYLWTDGKIHHDNTWILNNTLFDLSYRLAYTLGELWRWRWMDWSWALKTMDDLTYFSQIRQWPLKSLDLITPQLLKWVTETIFNKNTFHWWKVYEEWMWLNDTKWVSNISKFIASLISIWEKEWPIWEKVWWFQVNPKAIDNIIKFANPEKLWTLKALISYWEDEVFLNNIEWITPKESSYIRKMFWSTAKIMDNTIDELYKSKEDIEEWYNIQKNFIKNSFKEVSTKEEAWKVFEELYIKSLKNYWEEHKLTKYLDEQLLNRLNELDWVWINNNISNLTANSIWKRMAKLTEEWNVWEIEKLYKSLEDTSNDYKINQVKISYYLYTAKDLDELTKIAKEVFNKFDKDKKTNDYIRNQILEVRDYLNSK